MSSLIDLDQQIDIHSSYPPKKVINTEIRNMDLTVSTINEENLDQNNAPT